jgi:hypothetical protein
VTFNWEWITDEGFVAKLGDAEVKNFEKTHRYLQHLDVADSRTPPAQRNHKLMDTPPFIDTPT